MLSRFFIDRRIFAAVLSLFLVLAGLAAMRSLPIAQYPEIAPPVVTVQAVYPGASAQTIEQTVASPIENAINGVPGMIYMSSSSGSNGVLQIQVTFDIGTNVDIASVNVNNRVNEVIPRLPEEVRRHELAERAVCRRQSRPVAVETRAGPRLHGHGTRLPLRSEGIRADHRPL